MLQQFVPYEQSLILKELGFDEPCFGYYNSQGNYCYEVNKTNSSCNKPGMHGTYCTVPLYQQVFKWFRDNHNLCHTITNCNNFLDMWEYNISAIRKSKEFDYDYDSSYDELLYLTPELTELECIKRLITIIS
jgi:hypothetical protein